MERFAKKFRVMGSICLLLELVTLFLPFMKRVQENYPDDIWSRLDYIQGAIGTFTGNVRADLPQTFTTMQAAWILGLMALPLVIAVAACVWGIVGDHRQRVSSILIFLVFLLDIIMFATKGNFLLQGEEGQSYLMGNGSMYALIISGVSSVFSVLAWIATPKIVKETSDEIPQVAEIKQQQVEAKYNVMLEEQPEKPQAKQQMPPHGVLVGIKGLYAGAEIAMKDGEEIRLGRAEGNHLIFTGQRSVSRNHCKIRWNEAKQSYLFLDYSSSGTYLNGSNDCLPQNLEIEVPCGSQIALGNRENIFLLK